MHRQGETEYFDGCPICKESAMLHERKRINVREGVWFELCPKCYSGIRNFMVKPLGSSRHPALSKKRGKR